MVFLILTYIGMLAILFWLMLNIFLYFVDMHISHGFLLTGYLFYGVIFTIVAAVFLALLKPLFRKRHVEDEAFHLHPEQEPLLFEFVTRICRAVGSPPPTEITVDTHVNAGASFVSGALDRRMRLLIGLPLVLAFDTRQFAGVIAHEFGHFSQTSGMRLTYAVRSIDAWFSEAAFARDRMDEKIYELSHAGNILVRLLFLAVRAAVWLARMGLILLVMVGHFFVSRLLQQMEYDADRHETRLVGSQCFAKTARSLRMLEFCHAGMIEELQHYRRTKQLPDNLPALLVDSQKFVDENKFREIEEKLLKVKTEWSDTHPSDRDRIENAAKERTNGTFTIEYPAAALFSNVKGLCQLATKKLYREVFEKEFVPNQVQNTDVLIKARSNRRTEGKAALRFALEQFCGFDTFVLRRPKLGKAVDTNTYRQETQARRNHLMRDIRAYAKIRQQEEQVSDDMANLTCARRLIEAGFDLSNAEGVFQVRTIHQSVKKLKTATLKDNQFKQQLGPFRQVMGDRLLDALEFLRSKKIALAVGEDESVVAEIKQILEVWNCIIQLRPTLEKFFFETRVNALLLTVAEDYMDERVYKSIQAALARLTNAMIQIQRSTFHLMYPFEHGLGEVSLAHYLVPELPKKQDVEKTMGCASDLDDNLAFLLRRCVARLGSLAEKVEKTFGFDPLQAPPEVANPESSTDDRPMFG